ncbi:MAG TPA: type II toxin-antitoxin system prevent-host-death family antitoxin [Candidatus Acidoferrales bacterium]
MEFNVHKAKTHFSRLLQHVADGEEVTIARAGVPVARLVRIEPKKGYRPMGMDEGKVVMAEDFDAPLPAELLALFLGSAPPRTAKTRTKRKPRKKT